MKTGQKPSRARKKPDYYGDYVSDGDSEDRSHADLDCCYRIMCDVPRTYADAVTSPESKEWIHAMDEEMHSLKGNGTFTLTALLEGKKAAGGLMGIYH